MNKLYFDESYTDLGKAVGLLHDLGRFRQMLETGTYSDASSFEKKEGISDHGDYGVNILFNEKLIELFSIDPKYYLVLYNAIKYHGKLVLPNYLNYQIGSRDKTFSKLNIEQFLSSYDKNDITYLKFLSLYVQLIRDADKIDIYDQHLINDFPVVRPYFNYGPKGDSLEKIAADWGISVAEIKNYNYLDTNDISKIQLIKIPVSNMDRNKLAIPNELIKQFINGNVPAFKELVEERWYNFITAALVRLNFLRDINFIPTLTKLQDQQILDKIYSLYPDNYKPLVREIFVFAQRELIDKPIKENKDSIYVKK